MLRSSMLRSSLLCTRLSPASGCALAGTLLLAAATLTGCGLGVISHDVTPAQVAGTGLKGVLHGGQSPITGATIKLYVTATNTGYGQASSTAALATTTTDASGSFTINPSSYTCPAGAYAFITAAGGDALTGTLPTDGQGNPNPNFAPNKAIMQAAVVGLCGSLPAYVSIDEVTTVATAYALGNFASDTGNADATQSTVTIGSTSTNVQGLKDAVANAQLLVTGGTGYFASAQAAASTATMALPTAMLNSLANTIAACVNTASPTSTQCTRLAGYTTPPGSSTAPVDTFQMAMNMAKYPGSNVANILALPGSITQFSPFVGNTTVTATTAPIDLTLAVSYTNPALQASQYNSYLNGSNTNQPNISNGPVGITMDANDNVWVAGGTTGTALSSSNSNYLSELTAPSNSPAYTNTNLPIDATNTLRSLIFDKAGNLFVSDKTSTTGTLIEVANGSALSGATQLTAFGTGTGTNYLDPNDWATAVDGSNNVFTTSYAAQGKCTTTGTTYTYCQYIEYPSGSSTPVSTFGSPAAAKPTDTVRNLAIDTTSTAGAGSVFAPDYNSNLISILTAGGALSTVTVGATSSFPIGVALDATGGAYVNTVAGPSNLYYVAQGGTTSAAVATTGQPSTIPTFQSAPSSSTLAPSTTYGPGGQNQWVKTPYGNYIAVDGAGRVFVANSGIISSSGGTTLGGTVLEYDPVKQAYLSPYFGFAPSLTPAATSAAVQQISGANNTTYNIYVPNSVSIGQTVSLSGLTTTLKVSNSTTTNVSCLNGGPYPVTAVGQTPSSFFTITVPASQCSFTTLSAGNAASGSTITFNASFNQSLLNCSGTSCYIQNGLPFSNGALAIDKAGTVWTMNQNGTLTGLIGLAAPTQTVLANGGAGSRP